jgi:hypothetical protein
MQQFCQSSYPSANYECECNLLVTNCNSHFAYLPKMKAKCHNDIHSLMKSDLALLESTSVPADDVCTHMAVCP